MYKSSILSHGEKNSSTAPRHPISLGCRKVQIVYYNRSLKNFYKAENLSLRRHFFSFLFFLRRHFFFPFLCQRTFSLFLRLGCCKQCGNEHGNRRDTEATEMSTDRGMGKTWHIHTVKCHSAIKENEITSLGRMEPEIATLTEVGQTEKGKYHMTFLVCGSKKKLYKWTYLQDRMRLTGLKNKLMVARGEKNRSGDS